MNSLMQVDGCGGELPCRAIQLFTRKPKLRESAGYVHPPNAVRYLSIVWRVKEHVEDDVRVFVDEVERLWGWLERCWREIMFATATALWRLRVLFLILGAMVTRLK
jgi:hypothetical protein